MCFIVRYVNVLLTAVNFPQQLLLLLILILFGSTTTVINAFQGCSTSSRRTLPFKKFRQQPPFRFVDDVNKRRDHYHSSFYYYNNIINNINSNKNNNYPDQYRWSSSSSLILYATTTTAAAYDDEKDYRHKNTNPYDFNRQKNKEWLMERFKFTKSKIKQQSHNYLFLTQDNSILEGRADYIQQILGFNNKEMNRIVQMNPSILSRRVDTNLGPTLKCFETTLKWDTNVLKEMVLTNPVILHSPKESIEPKLDYLQNRLEVDKKRLMQLILRYPAILSCSLEDNIKPTIDWIQQRLSLEDEQVRKIIYKHPQFLTSSIEGNLEPTLEWIQQRLSLTDVQVGKISCRFPSFLGCSIEENLEPTLEWIQQRLSLSDTGLSNLVVTQPELLGCNVTKNLAPKINFYIEAADVEEGTVIDLLGRTPRLLSAGLKRLNLRLEEAKEAGLTIDTGCLQRMAIKSPDVWARSIAYRHRKLDKDGQQEELW